MQTSVPSAAVPPDWIRPALFRSFASLLGRLPGGLSSNPGHLMFTILTLNEAAFARLLAYTGHDADRFIRAIPSLAPAASADPGEPPTRHP